MIANTAISVASLDTDDIKSNLRNFLQGQSQFQGYNFDGPALSVLIELLAYNTYLNAFYANMSFSEEFNDSGVMRASVVSRAKELGYTPWSAQSAVAKISVRVIAQDAPAFINVERGTKFGCSLDGNEYRFVIAEDTSVIPDDNGNYIGELVIYEGEMITDTYVVNDLESLTYVLANENADTRSIVVTVYDSETSTQKTTWDLAKDNLLDINRSSKVFYLQENMDGLYEVYFGDGVLGKKPSIGNKIVISYRTCNTTAPNGIAKFNRIDNIGGYSDYSITTVESATGGAEREDIESIRFNAPKHFARQNRTVIAADHQGAVKAMHPDVEAITAWGGEDNDPPIYGKVYLSVKPKNGFSFTQTRKLAIQRSLDELAVMGIDPVVVDPTFLYVVLDIDIRFDPKSTSYNSASIRQIVAKTVSDYETSRLSSFERKYRNSKLGAVVDNADPSIRSSNLRFVVQKRFLPILNDLYSYTLAFNTPLRHPHDGYYGCVTSTGFRLPAYAQTLFIDDDGYGKLRAYYKSGDNNIYVTDVGTVDYYSGRLDIKSFNPVSIDGSELKINVQPRDSDIIPVRNQIILITDSRVNIYDDNDGTLLSSGSVITSGTTTSLYETPVTPTVVI